MAKCDVCGKGVHFGNNVSHSHRRSNAIWNANVKSVKCKVNGVAVILVPDDDTTFPSTVITLAHQSVTRRSSFCHVVTPLGFVIFDYSSPSVAMLILRF